LKAHNSKKQNNCTYKSIYKITLAKFYRFDSYNDASYSERRALTLFLCVSSGDRWITTCKDHEEPFAVLALHFISAFPTVCSHARTERWRCTVCIVLSACVHAELRGRGSWAAAVIARELKKLHPSSLRCQRPYTRPQLCNNIHVWIWVNQSRNPKWRAAFQIAPFSVLKC